ncbi:MAG: hypothetical protein EAZ92_07370 [Candidatus Kapaibacterium sp.]|nr:MAG: hypothetical protein EAZ92_07370 [Candidatus Kapabacteria bacterium]
MYKALYIMLACNLMAAAVFFVGGTFGGKPLMSFLGWIFICASAALFLFMYFVKKKYPTLK